MAALLRRALCVVMAVGAGLGCVRPQQTPADGGATATSSSSSSSSGGGGSSTGTSMSGGSSGAGSGSSAGLSSSGGAGSSGPVETWLQFCMEQVEAFCAPYECQPPAPAQVEQCRTQHRAECLDGGVTVAARADAGEITFDVNAARGCLPLYRQYMDLSRGYVCNTATYEDGVALFFGEETCANGVPQGPEPGLTAACDAVLAGQRGAGAACVDEQVCARGRCVNRNDAGVGECETLAEVGAACVLCPDAGRCTNLRCVDGARCDAVSRTCVAEVALGAACGTGTGFCSAACHTTCQGGDAGPPTCQAFASNGEACSPAWPCAPGTACVRSNVDGGAYGTCRAHVGLGAACSRGRNNEHPGLSFLGSHFSTSDGPEPLCGFGLRCDVVDGGVGACVPATSQTGQPCAEDTGLIYRVPQACALFEDACQRDGDGGKTCLPKAAARQRCEETLDCQGGRQCVPGDGGSVCR